MFEPTTIEPFALESLTSYVRRAARHHLFADPVAFLRAGGVDWPDRSRDLDLVRGPALQPVAAFLNLDGERAVMLTVHPWLLNLPPPVRGSLRRWIGLMRRTRVCARCVAERPYGRLHWRFPLVTECLAHRRPLLDECRVCGAVRERSSRRWERFDCGHHVHRSAEANSLPVDLRVQQAIQAALRIGAASPTHPSAWLLQVAIAQRSRLVEVQAARQTLREVWTELRRNRAVVHQAAQALRGPDRRGRAHVHNPARGTWCFGLRWRSVTAGTAPADGPLADGARSALTRSSGRAGCHSEPVMA